MSKTIFAIALVSATFGLSQLAPAKALTNADCRPLTQENARACCAAANWKALIRSGDEALCKKPEFSAPLAATPPATATTETPETPPGTEPSTVQAAGNNNGHGNLDQNAPGNSEANNNAENSENSGQGNSGTGGGGKSF